MKRNNFVSRALSAFLCTILLAAISGSSVSGQDPKLLLSSGEIDFGKIATVSYIPKTIEFSNNSSEKLAILLVEKTPDIKVSFERKFYDPGEKGIIAFSCEPRSTGEFEEIIYIYTNIDITPYPVKLKGKVVSITECFPDPDNMLKRSIEVIDSITKEPVPDAKLLLVHNNKFDRPLEVKVNKEGKAVREMPIGLYHITAQAQDYDNLTTEIFVPKSQPYVILEMTPFRKVPVSIQEQLPREDLTMTPDEKPAPMTSVELPEDKYAANNLIFLLDVSTSMKSGKKFLLLQQSVNNLAMILRPIDNVSIITYSNDATIVLTGVNGGDKDRILSTVQELQLYGITRGVKGLNTAYELARQNYIDGGNNQVILMTDGEFSEKGLSDSYYIEMLSRQASGGISISILGFGINQEAIDRMKLMCRSGNGSFILVRSDEFVKDALIDEIKAKSFIKK
jgi:hypothetical protein